ncbi:MAG: hypothetical protein MUD08_01520 [Cytophagales bacterium]|nr:hypothetical protein [Cytophagales bacterium]
MKALTRFYTFLFVAILCLNAYSQDTQPTAETVSIRNIFLTGNQVFDEKTLIKALGLPVSKRHKKDNIQLEIAQADLTRGKSDGKTPQGITSLYRNRGYWFFSYQVLTTPVGNGQADLQIRVFEGPQMKIGQITTEGETPFAAAEIQRLTKLSSGEVFNEFKVISSFAALRRTGKVKGNAQVAPRLNPKTNAIDIVYTFDN